MTKHAPATLSFSVDEELKQDLNKLAAEEGRSQSDLFREMYNYYRFRLTLRNVQEQGTRIAAALGLETEDDVFRHLNERRAA